MSDAPGWLETHSKSAKLSPMKRDLTWLNESIHESIADIRPPFENVDTDLFRLLTDNDDDEDVVTRREGSTKYGRRSEAGELHLHLENPAEDSASNPSFDLLSMNTERRTSARYGRRSQSNQTSRATSVVAAHDNQNSSLNETPDNSVENRLGSKIEQELLGALEKCNVKWEENLQRKNSARYGRRAGGNPTELSRKQTNCNSSFLYKTKLPVSQKLPDRKKSFEDANSSNKALEESWKSLRVFNKRHKGRISESNNKNVTVNTSPSAPADIEDFVIPELPRGETMEFDIISTWGDKHYVGLNGIELFNSAGKPIEIKKVSANPADINVLPEYDKDPRVAKNLFGSVNRTRDDMYLWLTPFTPGAHHYINIEFFQPEIIAMIRIWNYNKSRIHSYRGVRNITICLDNVCIFNGEIARANGEILGSISTLGDTVLYTLDEEILQRISENDTSYDSIIVHAEMSPLKKYDDRPLTADIGDFRPLTNAQNLGPLAQKKRSVISPANGYCTSSILCEESLTISIMNVWSQNALLVGFAGLEVIGETGSRVDIAAIECSVPNTNVERLLNEVNLTTDETQMWLTEVQELPILIKLKFSRPLHLSALTIWNYNVSAELSYYGVKLISLSIDSKEIADRGVIEIRRAPGHCHFDFGQRIPLLKPLESKIRPVNDNLYSALSLLSPRRVEVSSYEHPAAPRGFVYQIVILSTWGDQYYVGLNGIQMYDIQGRMILLKSNNISAYPPDVNILDGIDNDVRTSDKLVNGINDTDDGCNMWLAPVLPSELNRIYVIFDEPISISMIRLWNYRKTPSRGVKEFGILVDDLLVYNGIMEKSNQLDEGMSSKTVIFSVDEKYSFPRRNSDTSTLSEAVDYKKEINERLHSENRMFTADQSQRPLTSLNNSSRTYYQQKELILER